ncbi:MAG: hypothetical protein HOA57_01160 [Candidatus Magasanikbacteria bacterium]|jgi:ribulose-phosphate 3-epimerase|nr:hypothetical protein [Candidatus Magasanikbacteria bacterium]MBT4315031.1 hypothetical protein [Candidatus Magasanikbacteria bacterium]MBT4546810.1 hypothetical protein [Candidatus Magasanikbacteria bacterium]MBT6818975.1 hypothetical protein [Candidatus Magasanikbacteria bacterium]
MIQIIPSVLVKSKDEFINQVSGLEDSVTMIQLDIADGKFVPNTTWADPEIVKKNCDLSVELHLMVSDPLEELKKWKKVKQIKRVLVHFESVNDFREVIFELENETDWQLGIVINPDTPYEKIEPYLNEVASVMFMGVIPGKQGQGLISEVLDSITNFTIDYPDMLTEIDGAVNEETLPAIAKTGVKAICPGSAIFGNDKSPKENVEKMEDIINKLA